MPRGQNFYYQGDQNLGASLGASLGRALFGDPAMAMKQREAIAEAELRAAQTRRQDAAAGFDTARTTGQTFQNTSAQSLAGLIDLLRPRAQPAPQAMPGADPLAALPDAPPQADPAAAFQNNIGAVIAAMAGAQGDKVDTSETVGALASFLGGDELARRGMIAQGHTPGKDFAITPGRADDIRNDTQAADLGKATAVATINNRDDIPVANIQAQTARRGQDVSASTARRGQDIKSSAGFSIVSDVLPGALMTGEERTPQRNREVGGAENSFHLPGDGVEAYDVRVGTGAKTFAEAEAKMRAKYGSRLVEAKDESNRPGYDPHWHFAVQTPPKVAGKGKGKGAAPKGINAPTNKLLDEELDRQLEARNMNLTPGARVNLKSAAIRAYQESGDHVGAINGVLQRAADVYKSRQAGKGGGNQPPVKGARKAPDGKWYVQQGKNADGSPRYARVDS
jgi:hypothetical protein